MFVQLSLMLFVVFGYLFGVCGIVWFGAFCFVCFGLDCALV